ncbi:hypothetical protein RHGRI_020531 [Rhododendron griersonianum]|uniref:DUF1995 domain-containing protein n=1 Tax=Rhododendron griersonianum TaxID=479676 RepID=A0AAV6JHX9_9ERIC|nr:hypothetical protein RHGRI_020531 [Rhododendron griersonianum]
MPLSRAPTASRLPIAIPSLPIPEDFNCRSFKMERGMNLCNKKIAEYKKSIKLDFETHVVSGNSDDSVGIDVPFPNDYSELLEQAKEATELALKDNKQLMEIEFPTAGLESVPGDAEGGTEMTGSMQLIREFCDLFVIPEKATRTRIFFPEANEVKFARQSVFGGASFKLDYLTKPSFLEDFGFVSKVKMADRVKPEDEMFLAAYPYYNVNEMLVVEELYNEAVAKTTRKLIIFNGELDRIRSGFNRCFFFFFRCYPGPWKVLRKVRGKYVCLHKQEVMPSLKEVALDILPSA